MLKSLQAKFHSDLYVRLGNIVKTGPREVETDNRCCNLPDAIMFSPNVTWHKSVKVLEINKSGQAAKQIPHNDKFTTNPVSVFLYLFYFSQNRYNKTSFFT